MLGLVGLLDDRRIIRQFLASGGGPRWWGDRRGRRYGTILRDHLGEMFPQPAGQRFGAVPRCLPGSAFIGVAISAWVAGTFGWRAALVAVSVPGLVIAAVLLLLVREPPRTRAEKGAVPSLAA